MAFRLRSNEAVAHGLRRLAKKQLRSARQELRRAQGAGDVAVHGARKRIKKVRAIRDLIDADAGRGLGRDGKRLRKVNRTLSELRDADAMIEILDTLKHQDPQLVDEQTFARLRQRLASHKQTVLRGVREADALAHIEGDLRRLHTHVKRWRPRHRQFGALAAGLRATLRRGRKAMRRAHEDRDAAGFHAWRKQLKALWYALRLVENGSPAIGRDVAALHRAERALGNDHNISVLLAELSTAGRAGLGGLRRAAQRHQAELRLQAAADAKRIYDASPGDYVRRVKQAWKIWRRRDQAARTPRPQQQAA